jgi:hypothetical protein
MSASNSLKDSQSVDNNYSSPSNAIDQMISLAIFDYGAMKKALSNDERINSCQRFVFKKFENNFFNSCCGI